jgi:hypothetical protein
MWPLDRYQDYASWKLENQEMLELFKTNNNVIYDRFEPIYVVLEYIYDLVVNGETIDEDLEIIFESGFNYLNNEFEVIKIYYDTLFQKNCDDFIEYSELVLYLIYLLDFRSDLENNGVDSNLEELNELETMIENMVMERKKDLMYVSEKMNTTLNKINEVIDYEYISIVDIFVEIAENLGIFLYEEDEFLVGEEI